MDIQKEREAFEKKFPVPAHWIDFCGLTCKYICKCNVIDDQTLKYQARWESWLAAKAQAVPDTYTPIVLALESVQSKIAKTSFLTMDEENENEVMAVDANELAAYIDKLIEVQEASQ